jgi:lipoyl(octanoyl) transferase
MSKPARWSVPHITLMSKSPHVRACWLGSTPYSSAWDLQAELVAALRDGRAPDTLLLLEHPHVFTMGKAASPNDVLWDEDERRRSAVDLIWSDRGGEATYHGPGQLVGYPILDLAHFGITIPQYIETLEKSLIDYLAELGVASARGGHGLTGVWSNGEKVAAIGIKLNRSVVSHGFALNVTTDLAYFDGIIPCGHADKRPTSVAALTGRLIDIETTAHEYAHHFERVFGTAIDWVAAASMISGTTARAAATPHI